MRPSQKFGSEKPTRANTVEARSTHEFRLTAETMPIGTAMASEMTSAAAISSNVTGSRCRIASVTG